MNLDIPIGIQRRFKRLMDDLDGSKDVELSRIYKDVDFYYSKAVAPYAACKKGCSFCCYVPVEVTQVEARYIASETGANLIELTENKTKTRDGSPCPFLKNGVFSIYRVRPLACRVFASLDSADNCADGNKHHWINNIDSYPPTKMIGKLLVYASIEMDGATYADIREWFKT
ncbi:TPA: YkgJ family cysteine cluster protein [Vibrio harveyi]|nr:YkgJ family cysteine cluster protein [Vibrio harveyi]